MKIEIQADQIFDIKQQAEKQPDELKERINTGTGTDKLDTAGEAALPWNQWQLSRGMGGRLRLESVATLVWNTHCVVLFPLSFSSNGMYASKPPETAW